MKQKYYLFEINSLALNVVSIIIMIVLLLLTQIILTNQTINIMEVMSDSLLFLIPYFVFHEILHSIGYVVTGANFKYITYGAHIEKGILCCLCKQNVSKKSILTSLLFPFIIIGVITYIIGIIINSPILILL